MAQARLQGAAARPVKPNGHALGFEGDHPDYGLPYELYTYRDVDARELFFVGRYRTSEQSGEYVNIPWCFDGDRWRIGTWPAPRPLYGLELLAALPDAKIVLFDTESLANAARVVLTSRHVAISFAGPAPETDFTPLAGRYVVLWSADAHLPPLIPTEELHAIDEPIDIRQFIAEGASAAVIGTYAREHLRRVDRAAAAPTSQPAGTQVAVREAHAQNALPAFKDQVACWQHFDLAMGVGGRPWQNLDNVLRIFELHPDYFNRLWYDDFRQRVMYTSTDGKTRIWNDAAENSKLTACLQRDFYMAQLKSGTVAEAIECFARRDTRHPVKHWLEQCIPGWDRVERLSSLFSRGFGAEDSDYTRAVSRSFLISLIARIYEPGCMVKTMPVLEGAQDIYKSTGIQTLAGDWYLDCTSRLESKDFYQDIQGYWLIELSELSSMIRTDADQVKACLSRRDDVYRAPYERKAASHPRQCVFAGSTNRTDWQSDDTGGARFLPIACTQVSIPWLCANREQFFAEAAHAYHVSHEKWWNIPHDQAHVEQSSRHVEDPWLPVVEGYLAIRDRVTVVELLRLLEVETANMRTAEAYRVSRILQKLGWRRTRTEHQRYYERPAMTPMSPMTPKGGVL